MALQGRRPLRLEEETLVAPPLLWSETTSALHELAYRGEVEARAVTTAIASIDGLRIERRGHPQLHVEASRLASRLGWAKTYDAEYVALASLTSSPLLTRDARLRRGASGLITVLAPADL